jgi:hypothetical protein
VCGGYSCNEAVRIDFIASLQFIGDVEATLKDHGTVMESIVQGGCTCRRGWDRWGSLAQMENSAESGFTTSRSKVGHVVQRTASRTFLKLKDWTTSSLSTDSSTEANRRSDDQEMKEYLFAGSLQKANIHGVA